MTTPLDIQILRTIAAIKAAGCQTIRLSFED